MLDIQASEATATRRRVYFHLVGTDGITPATGENGGQPQISTNGAAWTNTGIGTLTAIGNGRYYADLTTGAIATAGDRIETRYQSASTAECPGDSFRVVSHDPIAGPAAIDIDGKTLQKVLRGLAAVMLGTDVSTNEDVRQWKAIDNSVIRVAADKSASNSRTIVSLNLD